MKNQTPLTLILLLLSVGPLCGSQAGDSEDVTSVCSALEDVENYRGKMVTLTGWLTINWYHGVRFLSPNEDGLRCPGLQGKRSAWPSRVLLVWPNGKRPHDPVPFESQPGRTWELLYNVARYSDAAVAVRAVIEGELQSRKRIRITSRGEGRRPSGNGYGREGGYPAQLVIKRIVNIEKPIEVY